MDLWPDGFVADFIASRLNFFMTDHPGKDAGKVELTNWKWWLWLEQQGHDFIDRSLRQELIVQFEGDADAFSYEQERVLLFQIRNIMRGILGIDPLPIAYIDTLIRHRPVDFSSHWTLRVEKDGRQRPDETEMSAIVEGFDKYLSNDCRDTARIVAKAVFDSHKSKRYEYDDKYTGNGNYEIVIRPFFVKMVVATACLPLFAKYYEQSEYRHNYYLFYNSFGLFSDGVMSSSPDVFAQKINLDL